VDWTDATGSGLGLECIALPVPNTGTGKTALSAPYHGEHRHHQGLKQAKAGVRRGAIWCRLDIQMRKLKQLVFADSLLVPLPATLGKS
jgi:hypothetical protein